VSRKLNEKVFALWVNSSVLHRMRGGQER
jgi:hypothetical protein